MQQVKPVAPVSQNLNLILFADRDTERQRENKILYTKVPVTLYEYSTVLYPRIKRMVQYITVSEDTVQYSTVRVPGIQNISKVANLNCCVPGYTKVYRS